MTKGWALFTDERYLPLAQNFISSLLYFSNHYVYVKTINCDIGMSDSRIIQNKVKYEQGMNDLFYQKTQCSLDCPFDVVGQVEADMIANFNCDELLDKAEELDLPYTLHPIHGQDPNNQTDTMAILGVGKKTMPYSHATYIFTNKARQFLETVENAERVLTNSRYYPPNFDETIINCMLWKAGADTQLNCFDPSTELIPYYLGETDANVLDGYYQGKNLSWHIFHGSKDVEYMKMSFDRLQNRAPRFGTNVPLKVLK